MCVNSYGAVFQDFDLFPRYVGQNIATRAGDVDFSQIYKCFFFPIEHLVNFSIYGLINSFHNVSLFECSIFQEFVWFSRIIGSNIAQMLKSITVNISNAFH